MKSSLLVVIIFSALPPISIQARVSCPTQIESLANLLVRDLPSYANRAALKNRSRSDVPEMSQVIIASQPMLEPLDLPGKAQKPDPNLHQLFITTLERQTFQKKTSEFQQYHWLFLVQTRQGWKLSQSFTRISSYPLIDKITATRESSQGTIAQAVKTWLRDCQAGSIRPLVSPTKDVSNQAFLQYDRPRYDSARIWNYGSTERSTSQNLTGN